MNDASLERRWIRDVRCRNPGSREATKTVATQDSTPEWMKEGAHLGGVLPITHPTESRRRTREQSAIRKSRKREAIRAR
jgi:hypothetical protein